MCDERVSLRPATLEDRPAIYRALARSDVTDHLLGHPDQGFTRVLSYAAFCADYVQHYFDDSHPEGGRCFVIELDGRPIGQVNYNAIDRVRSITELDIWMFGERRCGHGYGTEALRLLCDHLQTVHGVAGFFLKPSGSNRRAIRSYEKAGFRRSDVSADEAARRYGPPDGVDTVYLTKRARGAH